MKNVFVFLLLSFCVSALNAQSESSILVSFDKDALRLLERKASSAFLQNLEQELFSKVGINKTLVRKIYEQPLSIGIATTNQLVGFMDIKEKIAHFGIQFPLSDAALFEQSITQYGENSLQNIKAVDPNIEDERIKIALIDQRNEMIERRKSLFEIQIVEENEVHFIIQNNFLLAWTSTHAFVIKSNVSSSKADVENYNGNIEQYYNNQSVLLKTAQLDYLAQLHSIEWQDLSNDITIKLDEIASNELNNFSAPRIPMQLLFDEPISLSNNNQQIHIDFEATQISVKLLEGSNVRQSKEWTKAALIAAWSDIQLEQGEDSLDVWFKVLNKRF